MDDQQIQPAPMSPEAVPGISDNTGLSQEEMVGNLKELMGKIQNKYQDFKGATAISDSRLIQANSQALREVFDLLQSYGVDPSNIDQVQQFLNKIKESNPELYQQIDKILQGIIGEDSTNGGENMGMDETSQDLNTMSPSNMNINTNETSQENI